MKEVKLYNKEKLYTLAYLTIIMEISLLYILYFDIIQKAFPLLYLRETVWTCNIFFISATTFAVYSISNILIYLIRKSKIKNDKKLEEVVNNNVKEEKVVE